MVIYENINLQEDYVSFEVAKLLKEKGFDEPCTYLWFFEKTNNPEVDDNGVYKIPIKNHTENDYWNNTSIELFKKESEYWNDDIDIFACPTLQMAMKWLREEKGIAIIPILSSILDNEKFLWDIKIVVAKTGESYSQGWIYEKQEEAFNTAIKYCLENLI